MCFKIYIDYRFFIKPDLMLAETTRVQNNPIENPSTVYTVNLFEHLPMAVLDLNKGDLYVESISKSIGQLLDVPLSVAKTNDSNAQISIADIFKSKLAPEDQAVFDEKGYERLKMILNEMQVGDTPYTHIDVTPTGEMEVRYRKIPEGRILFEMNPVKDHHDALTGFFERDVFERRNRRLNRFQTDPEFPERLKPVNYEHPINAFFADANNLKRVNDELGGHLAGNAYLLGIATALKIGVAGVQNIFDDIAIQNFIDNPDNGIYRKLFEKIIKPEFWSNFDNQENILNSPQDESVARKIMKMPDEIYRVGGDEFMGFINNADIINIRKRICKAVDTINLAISTEPEFVDKLPLLSFAIACAKIDGKTIKYVNERTPGDFFLANGNKNFSTFSDLEHDMDIIMYEHKKSIKLREMLNSRNNLHSPISWNNPMMPNTQDPYIYNDQYYKVLK